MGEKRGSDTGFAKYLRTPFLQNTSKRLLLQSPKYSSHIGIDTYLRPALKRTTTDLTEVTLYLSLIRYLPIACEIFLKF